MECPFKGGYAGVTYREGTKCWLCEASDFYFLTQGAQAVQKDWQGEGAWALGHAGRIFKKQFGFRRACK